MFPPNTSPSDWVKAFNEQNPQYADLPPFALGLWFLAAFEAGYQAAENGLPLDYETNPPSA